MPQPISPRRRNRCTQLLLEGATLDVAHKEAAVSKGYAQKIRTQLRIANKRSVGRPYAVTALEERLLKHLIGPENKYSLAQLHREFQDILERKISPTTVKAVADRCGLKLVKRRKKPKLTIANRKARLAWAKDHLNWTTRD